MHSIMVLIVERKEDDPESMKWKVLCEEITKILNHLYQRLKDMDSSL